MPIFWKWTHALLKIAAKGSFRNEKSENLAFLGYFSEPEEYEQSKLCSFHTYLWEVSTRVCEHNITAAVGGSE